MDGLSFDSVLNWMFCYFMLHNHKRWGWLSILQFKSPTTQGTRFFYLHPNLTSPNFSVLSQIITDSGEPHVCYGSPLWIPPSSVVAERQMCLCADKPFTCVSRHQQETKIRDQTCNLCQDKPSPNGDVILNSRMMLKNWLSSLCLGNLENACTYRKWSSNTKLRRKESRSWESEWNLVINQQNGRLNTDDKNKK